MNRTKLPGAILSIHPVSPPGCEVSEAPAAATNLPLHAGPVVGDGELLQSRSPVQGSPPGSDETWAGSTPRRLEALPERISDQCSSCEHIQVFIFICIFLMVSDVIEDAVPGAWGEGDEGMWRPCRCVCRVKTQRLKLLKERKSLSLNMLLGKENYICSCSYMWVRPNSRVVVCPIDTDQTDGSLGRITERHFKILYPHSLKVMTNFHFLVEVGKWESLNIFFYRWSIIWSKVGWTLKSTSKPSKKASPSHPLVQSAPLAVPCPGCTSWLQPAQEGAAGETLWCTWWWREGWTDPPFRKRHLNITDFSLIIQTFFHFLLSVCFLTTLLFHVHLVPASDPSLPACISPDSVRGVPNYTASSKSHWLSCHDLWKK